MKKCPEHSIQKNMQLKLKIDAMSSEGAGIAHYSDNNVVRLAIFVPGAIIGEQVIAKIVKVQKNCAYARLNEILQPSPNRIKPDCPHYRLCGGCNLAHMTYASELEFKRQKVEDALNRIGKLNVEVSKIHPSENIFAYRNKTIYPISDSGIGMYRSRSHDVIPTNRCMLQSDTANNVLQIVESWRQDNKVPAHKETTHKGILRHLMIRTNYKNQYLVCIISSSFNIPNISKLAEKLAKDNNCVGLVVNKNSRDTNVILGSQYKTIYGQNTITDQLCGINFELSIPSFFQINRQTAETLYNRATHLANINPQTSLVDLYCGAGTITLAMARHCKNAVGVEIVPQAIKNAEQNALANNIQNATFICGDAATAAKQLAFDNKKPDVICVDPPRRGLDSSTINSIIKMSPHRIVYISCKPSTLARDLHILAGQDSPYSIKTVEAVDMFPRTHHVETIVLLTKN